jgi:hypothetical protein
VCKGFRPALSHSKVGFGLAGVSASQRLAQTLPSDKFKQCRKVEIKFMISPPSFQFYLSGISMSPCAFTQTYTILLFLF